MKCPKCNSECIYVTNTNPSDEGPIYRCRKCLDDGSEEFKRGYHAAAKKKWRKNNAEN